MSKIIVDEIQKNGGDTLTLPTTDATANNQPMVGSSSGVLSFSPLALPAADSDANKPVTTDGSAQLQFGGFALPSSAGSSGQVLTSNGTAATWSAPGGGFTHAYEIDYSTTAASSTIILWTDIFGAGTAVTDIDLLQINFQGISSSGSNWYLQIYGRDSGGDASAGNYGQLYHGVYSSGTNMVGQESNSYLRIPAYAGANATDYSYGSGMWGQVNLYPEKEGSYGNIGGAYFIGYEQTSYTNPTAEQGSFGQNSTTSNHEEWALGMRIAVNTGSLNRGKIVVLGRK